MKKIVSILTACVLAVCLLASCGANPAPKVFSVTFDMNGAEGVSDKPDAQNVTENEFAGKPAVNPSATGKVFLGWRKDAAGTAEFLFPSTPITADTVIYAAWRELYSYTLSFDANGVTATGMPAAQSVKENAAPAYPSAQPKADGKLFTGWYTSAACTQNFDFTAPLSANATTFAKWTDSSKYLADLSYVEYNTFRGGNGLTDAKSPISADDMELKWKAKLSTGWTASMGWPIEVGEYIYLATTQGGAKINKLSKADGSILASHALAGSTGFFTTITYGDGKIYVPLQTGIVQAFDAETLTPLWKSKVPTNRDGSNIPLLQSLSSAVYHNGYLYMGVSNGQAALGAFFCLSAEDEDPAAEDEEKDFTWFFNPKDLNSDAAAGFYWSVGTVAGDYIVFGGEEGVLYSHSLTGNAVDENGVTVMADSFVLSNSEGSSGAEAVRSAVFYDEYTERLYTNTKAGSVHSIRFNAENGTFDTESYRNRFIAPDITSSPTAYRGRLYVGGGGISSTAPFSVLNAETLEIIYQIPIISQSSPMVTTAYATEENRYKVYIYVLKYATPDGLYLLEDWQGKTAPDDNLTFIQSPNVQYNSSSVMIGKDGTLYYKNDSGYLFALGGKTENSYTAADVANAVQMLPEAKDFRIADRKFLLRAYYRYSMLSDTEKAQVENYVKLEELMLKLFEMEK